MNFITGPSDDTATIGTDYWHSGGMINIIRLSV